MLSREEKLTVGVLCLLFGLSWIAYASIQPLVFTGNCAFGGANGPFMCLDYAATLFYSMGFLAVLASVFFIAWRFWKTPTPHQD